MAVYSGLAPGGPKDRVGGLWQICSPQTAGGFSGTAYFFARELFRDLNVPIGIIRSAWSGSPIQPWTPREALLNHEAGRAYVEQRERDEAEFSREAGLAKVEKWKTENPGKKVPGSIEMLGKKPSETSRYPSTLYNAMIAPLIPYAIRGVVWYQGESNDQPDESRSYAQTFPSMIQAWRTHWGQGDFPFYFVQLANFRASSDRPLDSDTWANVRESQLKTLALPHTGMAVAIDIGEEKDVHPRNKIEVGRRLALWALAKDYGKDVVCSGPIYDRAQFDGNRVVIHFRETDGGLMAGQKEDVWAPVQKSDEPLKRFQICGEDRKWVWADARITGRDTVEVWSESIDVPVAVRYAWASNPEGCNLYNAAGLPASPFRTDDEK
jgi:sialate O-acetylesterase